MVMTNIWWAVLGASLCVGLLLLLVSGRAGDALYMALRHYKASLFVVLCLSVGALAGFNIRNLDDALPDMEIADISLPSLGALYQTSEEKTLATIRNCQAFVTSQIEQPARPVHAPPEPRDSMSPLLHLASDVLPPVGNTSRDWDRCARAFGTNYWKADISVKGQNGGIALCRAYRAQTEYRSGKVEIWCDTVFSEKTPPATH